MLCTGRHPDFRAIRMALDVVLFSETQVHLQALISLSLLSWILAAALTTNGCKYGLPCTMLIGFLGRP